MILPRDRKLATVLLKLRLFTWGIQKNELFNRCPRLRPTRFTRWIWDRMRKRQTRDGLHHAQCAPETNGRARNWSACRATAARPEAGAMGEYIQSDRDRWAEAEARACERTAEALEESGREWLAHRLNPESAKMALLCAIKAETWRQLADRLRRPEMIGREMTALQHKDAPNG